MNLADKNICTGCSACYSICPVHCITMEQDTEGFSSPVINEEKCIKCEKCIKICPAIVQGKERNPLHVYAAKNPDEAIRYQSSSGGIFTLLAEYIIHKGGVVFGARFNDSWEVIHDYTETIEGLAAFRGSKYVQSKIGDTYEMVKQFLLADRYVLFSGTPCQIAGLRAFMQNNYDKLLTVDLVCHGVPSPLVWRKYLEEILNRLVLRHFSIKNDLNITNIKFRDKKYGWRQYLFTIEYVLGKNGEDKHFFQETAKKNSFMRGFSNLFLRQSCHNCPVKSFKSGSDITIADYWGIQNVLPKFYDDKGISLVMVNSVKGKEVYDFLKKNDQETVYTEAARYNRCIYKSVSPSEKRSVFFDKWLKTPIIPLINGLTPVSLRRRFKRIIAILFRITLYPVIKIITK